MKTNNNLEETRIRILEAAERQFLSNGYDAARLEDIVREARVSKTAIYKIFGGKQELFLALNDSIIQNLMQKLVGSRVLKPRSLEELKQNLFELGKDYLTCLTEGHPLSLFRLNLSIATRFKDASINYYHSGPNALQIFLSQFFKDVDEANILDIPDSNIAADQFMALVRGNYHIKALMDIDFQPSSEAISGYVENSVHLFIAGYHPRG